MADYLTPAKLENASLDCDSWDKFFHGTEFEDVVTRLGKVFPTLPKVLKLFFDNGLFRPFQTEAQLLAYVPETNPSAAYAFDTKKLYSWDGSVWNDEGLSPLDLSKSYTDEQFILAVQKSVFETLSQLFGLAKSDDEKIKSLFTDGAGKVVIGYDLEKDTGIYAGMLEQVVEIVPGLKIYNDGRYLGLLADSGRGILIGYDMLNDLPVIAGLEELIAGLVIPNQKPLVKAVNHMLWYGESFSVGQKGTPPISVQQPYSNLTFDSTVRLINGTATATKPLVEDAGINNPPVSTTQGETCCSGAANYASRAMMLENGIDPNNHVIFASTAGHGSYRIDQLEKGTAWYPTLINHVTQAMSIVGPDYKVQCINFIQGANDALSTVRTPKSVYKPKLKQLRIDANADIKAVTQQSDDIKFIIAQMSYGTRAWSDQALSHLELVQEDESFCMATPMYHFPYDADSVHLTNIGYKWISAYFGRAYKQLIAENRQPDFINPIVAQLIGDEIHVKFKVPQLPLVIDTETLAVTTNHGFKVLVDGAATTISNITVQNDTVILKLSTEPTGTVKVRYALDYLGSGINLTEGASGNIRDSTDEVTIIDGEIKPLYHVCPHFELTAFTDKGI
ncbi:sialate O-acetylesterase [Acinetobacter baumannii]|uniref:sialate O-acetylesterase n=2 Tax=Acinetobacter baumannii TaxID=470 RepID=UPI001D0DDF64|nr:sialate O-acetylesterase [Acinetobacter baumannii]